MAMEVKMYCRKKKTDETRQIDHIPKCFQLPRSASTSKPRTQFFLPFFTAKDLELQEIQTSFTVRNSKMSNRIQLPVTNVKSFGQKAHIQPCSNRNNEDINDMLEHTPKTEGQIEKDNSSNSARARSKRERKPKVHFDEVSYPLYTSRKVRRFKIMRSLGLAAPVGSPFNSS